MRRGLSVTAGAVLVIVGLSFGAIAQDAPKKRSGKSSDAASASAETSEANVEEQAVEEQDATSHHSTVIGGQEIHYTATAGKLRMKNDAGETKAEIFFVSYIKDDVSDAASRPLTFSFNGGPGAASVWLHLGLMGPKRVVVGDEPVTPPPPYEPVQNGYSMLDVTDIVMIDPVSTGFSRPANDEDAKEFHGYREDINSVGEFIEKFVTTHGRWASPTFLVGESYGTTRAAGLAGELQDRHGLYLNGIVMVSSVLNFQTLRFDNGNDLPYVLFLPSYTATAWYHKRLPGPLQSDLRATLREVEQFAANEYNRALMKGDALDASTRQEVVAKLAYYTGLSREFVDRSNLRIGMSRFSKELLRDERRTIGRFDSRYQGIDRDAAGESMDYDPSHAALLGPYTAALNAYVRNELGYKSELKYNVSGPVNPWNYDSFTNRYLNVSETLRGAMAKNPSLGVFVANGYYDLATPYFASIYTYDHLGLDPALRKNLTMGYYEAGHMMYIHEPSLTRLKQDLTEFYHERLHTKPTGEDAGSGKRH